MPKNVTIFGVPRSGTSWLGQIFNSSPNTAYRYQPVFAYSFEGSLSESSSAEQIQEFHDDLLVTDDDFVCQVKNINGNKAPSFKKESITHLVWKEVRYLNIIENLIQKSPVKVIGIVRHPCGVLKSWMNAPKEFNESWLIGEEWRYAEKKNDGSHSFYGYERWMDAALMFNRLEKDYPHQFKTVVYESMIKDPESVSRELFDFTELEFTQQTKLFLQKSTKTHSDDPYDVYRENKTGLDWISELPYPIIESIQNDERFIELKDQFNW